MSIYTMQRKSRRFKAPISGHKKTGFSLNGPLRNQGWVGQGVRGRTIVGTPFRGITARGAGGCCGTYKKNIVDNSNEWTEGIGYSQPNCGDMSYIKRSNMNTPGHIDATVKHPTPIFNASCTGSNCPIEWTQYFDPFSLSQGYYIENKGGKALCKLESTGEKVMPDGSVVQDIKNCSTSECKSRSYFIGGKKFYSTLYYKNTVPNKSCGEYTKWDVKVNNCLPPPPCKQHFPMNLNHTATCDINYLTPEQAKSAGALPPTWPRCPPGTKPGSGF
jgi:hypothetical protein